MGNVTVQEKSRFDSHSASSEACRGQLEGRWNVSKTQLDSQPLARLIKEGQSNSATSEKTFSASTLSHPEILNYGNQESFIASELLKMRVSQFDILRLFIEILKLSINDREQQKLSRKQERDYQLERIEGLVAGYKKEGKWLLFAGVGAGVFGIISGISPILGHVKGNEIKDTLCRLPILSKMKGMKTAEFFESLMKTTESMSKMNEMTGQIQRSFCEGKIAEDQSWSQIHATDGEEHTRTIEEIKNTWRDIEQFVHQALQMHHDAARQLYS